MSAHQLLPGQPDALQAAGEDDGALLFHCTPGRFQLDVQPRPKSRGSDYFEIEREVVLHADRETLVECRAQLGGRIQLTVHLPGEERIERIRGFDATIPGAPGKPPHRLGPYVVPQPDGWIRGMGVSSEQPNTTRLIEPGRHRITITADGYQPTSISVLVEPSRVTEAAVFLQAR